MVGVGALVGSASSPLLSAAAAAVVAIAFQPARRRAQRFADRLVYGKRATPYEVLSAFSERLAGAYGDEDLLPRMARILGEGTAAERADVWLKEGDRFRPVAGWPTDAPALAAGARRRGARPGPRAPPGRAARRAVDRRSGPASRSPRPRSG